MVALVLFLIVVAGTFLKIPGNYKLFTVMSGSMEPKIKLGSLIFVKPSASYKVGDVITIKSGATTVTHRIAEISQTDQGTEYVTKGDANNDVDPEKTAASQMVGKEFFSLSYVGYPIGYARTRVGFILLVIVPSTVIVYEELYKIKDEMRKKWASRRDMKSKIAAPENVDERIRIIEDLPLTTGDSKFKPVVREEQKIASVQPVQSAPKYERRQKRKII